VANFRAVYSVGKAIADYLDQNYPAELKNAGLKCTFRPVASAEIATEDTNALDQTLSIFLHRITRNEQLRSPSRLVGRPDEQPTLFLDLHYLLTYWGSSAEAEQTILAAAIAAPHGSVLHRRRCYLWDTLRSTVVKTPPRGAVGMLSNSSPSGAMKRSTDSPLGRL
jgi:hypothetical protein